MRLLFVVMLTTLFFFNNLASASTSAPENQSSKESLKKIGDQFMSTILKGNTEQAYKDIIPATGDEKERFTQIGMRVTAEMKKLREQIGEPLSFDFITAQSIKDHFFKQIYLLKFNNAAIVWEINYYQPNQGWKIVEINYNANFDDLFEN